jgi:maltose O-acetyltransferase
MSSANQPGLPARLGRAIRPELQAIHPRLLLVRALLAPLPPYVGGRLRVWALRRAGFHIGRGSSFFGTPVLVGNGALQDRLSIGRDCYFNVGCHLELEASITIGDRVGLGHDVMILTSSHAIGSHERRAELALRREPVTIEDGAWLGARVVVLPGVTIGAGTVVAAGTVVTRDVPPDTLLAGRERTSLARWR